MDQVLDPDDQGTKIPKGKLNRNGVDKDTHGVSMSKSNSSLHRKQNKNYHTTGEIFNKINKLYDQSRQATHVNQININHTENHFPGVQIGPNVLEDGANKHYSSNNLFNESF
jgi:isopentenyl phosphate kinase